MNPISDAILCNPSCLICPPVRHHQVGKPIQTLRCVRKPDRGSSLFDVAPDLALEWHPTKNGTLTPCDVMARSGRDVLWRCPSNPAHEWLQEIRYRSCHKNTCPICSGRTAGPGNNLTVSHPTVANFWDYQKNGGAVPEAFAAGSSREVFWKCPVADDHTWKDMICQIVVRDHTCPYWGASHFFALFFCLRIYLRA